MKTLPAAEVILEVPFHDVDSMRVVWHGNYVKYLEIARTALTRSLGLDIQEMDGAGILWPVVVCHLKYVRPLRYGQKVRVRAQLEEYEQRIKISYRLTVEGTDTVLTKAYTVQLPVAAATGELLLAVPPGIFPGLAQEPSC
jgi:acyl-CoA thioester hydrolase